MVLKSADTKPVCVKWAILMLGKRLHSRTSSVPWFHYLCNRNFGHNIYFAAGFVLIVALFLVSILMTRFDYVGEHLQTKDVHRHFQWALHTEQTPGLSKFSPV